jgi:hypothetical protein
MGWGRAAAGRRPLFCELAGRAYWPAAGLTRCQKSLNATLSKKADAFVTLPSRMSRNQA